MDCYIFGIPKDPVASILELFKTNHKKLKHGGKNNIIVKLLGL